MSVLAKLRCGRKYRKRMEAVAEVDLFGDPGLAGEMFFSTMKDMMECAGIKYEPLVAASQYGRWRSFWQFIVASRKADTDRKIARYLLADLEESFSMPRAEELRIVEDYGPVKTKLLHDLAAGALRALDTGNIELAKRLAKRGADIQYWLAVMRLDS